MINPMSSPTGGAPEMLNRVVLSQHLVILTEFGLEFRFQAKALEALQEAAEAYLVNEFERKSKDSITLVFDHSNYRYV